jgi:hypothetical protein
MDWTVMAGQMSLGRWGIALLLVVAGIDDVNALSGFLLEKTGLSGSARGQQSDQVIWPWTATIATSVTKPWGAPLTSVITGLGETGTYHPLSALGNGGTPETRQNQRSSSPHFWEAWSRP